MTAISPDALPVQLALIEGDWTLVRGRRPRPDRGWRRAWHAPFPQALHRVPEWQPPPGSQVIDRTVRRGRFHVRELWVRPRPTRGGRRRS